jgi:hypothetical protein
MGSAHGTTGRAAARTYRCGEHPQRRMLSMQRLTRLLLHDQAIPLHVCTRQRCTHSEGRQWAVALSAATSHLGSSPLLPSLLHDHAIQSLVLRLGRQRE